MKKAEHRRIGAFELWCWRRLLRVPWTARRSNQSILKEISPGCSLEGMMLKLKLWPPHGKSWLIGKDPDARKGWGQEEKGMTEDEMAGWHHRLDWCESEWTPGDGDGQGGLACCNSWGCKESDTTERLNGTELLYNIVLVLPHIDINLPRVYMCSPSWNPLPPPSPYPPSRSSQCTSPKHPVSCIEPGPAIHFTYDNTHVSMPFSQIIPPRPLPHSPKDCSIHLCLSCCLAYRVIVTIFLNSIYMH